jgi:pyruvate-formate lyase-activating enzyme
MIPLPEGAELMLLPARNALARKGGRETVIAKGLLAVAAMLPPGYTRTFLPAFSKEEVSPQLPLYGYAAVAIYQDQIYVAAMQSDDNAKWNPCLYNTGDLKRKVSRVREDLPGNRIVEQLAGCSLAWHCCTAQNLFYRRWEAGIPVSPVCNARCFGCISLQPSECCPSPQNRIDFTPTAQEIAQVGIYHLQYAPEAIISFGQGCEGEPSLAAEQIAEGIKKIRAVTDQGIININTNGGYTEGIRKIVDAGINSMRVSIISAREEEYQAYYRANYTLEAVKESILYAKAHNVYVSLNMLLFPGFNDLLPQVAAWEKFLGETGVDMVQMRNLNVDPDEFMKIMPACAERAIGVRAFAKNLQASLPNLRIGSFSRYFEK